MHAEVVEQTPKALETWQMLQPLNDTSIVIVYLLGTLVFTTE